MKYIKYFESVNNGYERISYDIYSQSLNKLKGIPFDSTDITKIKSVVSGDVQTISDPKPVRTDKKKYMIKIFFLNPSFNLVFQPFILKNIFLNWSIC